jgi:hypothetical protein
LVQAFEVFGEPSAAAEPSEGALDNPAFGQNLEAFCGVRPPDDLDLELGDRFAQLRPEPRTGIAAIGEQPFKERPAPEQRGEQQNAAVAVLNIGGMHDGMQDQAERVDQDMALLAVDLLARVIARWVDAGPPFSAPFTLWLSMIATTGLASRPACSRQAV